MGDVVALGAGIGAAIGASGLAGRRGTLDVEDVTGAYSPLSGTPARPPTLGMATLPVATVPWLLMK